MKRNHIYFSRIFDFVKPLIALFLLLFYCPILFSQVSVTVSGGNCVGSFTLNLTGMTNGRNSFSNNVTLSGFTVPVSLAWSTTNSRWEISSSNPLVGLVFYNTANTTPDPPCYNNGTWVAVSSGLCAGGVFTGGGSTNCIIPVELLSFSAKNVDNTTVMNWQTATEIKNKGFEIERSNDGKSWQTMDFVAAKGNNSSYAYTDKTPFALSYYRLRQMDFDGQFTYSKTVSAHATHLKSPILVFPNPNTEGVIHIQGLTGDETNISITNLFGQIVVQQTVTTESVVLNVKNRVSTGVYFVNIKASNGSVVQKIRLE